MGLYDMIILLCGLKVEESVIFGNGPNRVDRPWMRREGGAKKCGRNAKGGGA